MADKKLEALQDEIKLLKGEIKQSLASVRDYLLNMELPSSEITTILAALGGDGEQKITMRGSFDLPPEKRRPEPQSDITETITEETPDIPEGFPVDSSDMFGGGQSPDETDAALGEEVVEEDLSGNGGGGGGQMQGDYPSDEGILPGGLPEDSLDYPEDAMADPYHDGGGEYPSGALPGTFEGDPMDYDNIPAPDINDTIPKVNMMANLINWVTRAKNEIGSEQLPTFLELYGVSGHLSPELKDVIIHLAELSSDKPETPSNAGIWSESMLSLHGILTGGDAPRHPMIPSWSTEGDIGDQLTEDEIIDVDQQPEQPVKLKLVFPNGNGQSKEFCINLTPEEDVPDWEKRTNN